MPKEFAPDDPGLPPKNGRARKLALITGITGQDGSNISRLVEKLDPDEIYNLGAQSHVKVSFEVPEYTAEVDELLGDHSKAKAMFG